MTAVREEAVVFDLGGAELVGVLHLPEAPAVDVAVVVVVGGPQYRVGSHRQFVLLARHLAAAGLPVLRFDYRGMGDSGGEARDFEAVDEDIDAAVSYLQRRLSGLAGVYLWGLCDAATANVFHAVNDDRVRGIVALNPWVRTPQGEAQAVLRHYYLQRFLSADFWRKILRFEWNLGASLRDLLAKLRVSRAAPGNAAGDALPERVQRAWTAFSGPSLLILSGRDLTAREFEEKVAEDAAWNAWLHGDAVDVRRLDEADHTFSTRAWRDQVADWTSEWILHKERDAS